MGVKSEEVCVSGAASLATAPFAALLMLIAALATAHIGRNWVSIDSSHSVLLHVVLFTILYCYMMCNLPFCVIARCVI